MHDMETTYLNSMVHEFEKKLELQESIKHVGLSPQTVLLWSREEEDFLLFLSTCKWVENQRTEEMNHFLPWN